MADIIVRVLEEIPPARELGEDEVRVLLQRHSEHQDNIPDRDAVDRIFEQGWVLGHMGYRPTVRRSSSSPRALWANLVLMSGIFQACKKSDGPKFKLADLPTEPALDAFGSQADDELGRRVMDYKSASYLEGDEVFWQLINEDPEFCSEVRRRGNWAARAIMKLVTKYPGQTILATSHGIAVLETAITHLSVFGQDNPPADEPIRNPEHKFSCGQIAELIFRKDKLVEVNFFPVP